MCGIFGIANHVEAVPMSYLGLYALQHRGQESCGISSSDGTGVYTQKGRGFVRDFFSESVIGKLKGYSAIGHDRYSTAGDKEDGAEKNAQPIVVKCKFGTISLAHNGNLNNFQPIRAALEQAGATFQCTSDSEIILNLIARSEKDNIIEAIKDVLPRIKGAYSLLILTEKLLIAVRDPLGIRPLAIGQLNGSYVFSSETCAFDLIKAEEDDDLYLRDVEPGEIIWVENGELHSERFARSPFLAQCSFEHVYFSRPDSDVFSGRNVADSRDLMGRLLAREHPIDADIVVPVQASGAQAALGFAEESGIRFTLDLIRNHYVARTFIEPKTTIRHFGVKLKHNPIRKRIRGKRVVLVDDSIMRSTTMRKLVRLIRAAGAVEVHVRISCPPTISPCFYGVDTPTHEELIAATHSQEEICKIIEADSLGYLSQRYLTMALGRRPKQWCFACWDKNYPAGTPQEFQVV
ncbi:MAG: amidophosphoribosyltransferase [Candidatus Doudnabacteria bacterium RIFCSPHIGHO2_02_FULL_48_21]|uniref:Amidophosphoribosyltransferase n=1 Tax=Candidatus Doudnabacteria bacterium RIFCSPLOWO2_02_FULL_48_13 TaxID=1817845 RepID=A0A1F5QCV0_9BACT|nr:MAG: amidophosphoribosyltransferase [Candidatus Doudnabacteria bacterium RIFCSPHIGHO2_01_48_18]OGE77182.1 MAG: amidophosphoribosyltransferase [Candidatus Doudnabacteria bacterium RIFCSPHIGHO2_01_FULL_48_180]OGE91571.1 MAG: amidophosphoribosyltransferase [Candidatus Doudnabacteria bacterium RIFCSPHIGHO2_12_FULL_47_25]OGE93161.1 MAG: amidophosphoribosyltransferase [Candidatus Doudnabacteria bacterium RIFCSPHIGHO2_02_FULL_48_21]OGE96566.1 MAG: amidophosphoribosyltransferase [Candidatus Doudnaba